MLLKQLEEWGINLKLKMQTSSINFKTLVYIVFNYFTKNNFKVFI